MKIALIDNYDSFTFNIFHYLKKKNVKLKYLEMTNLN